MTIVQHDVLSVASRLETQDGDDLMNVYQMRYEGVPPLTDTQGVNDVIEFLEAVMTLFNFIIPVLTVYRDITVGNLTQSINYGVFPWPVLANGLGVGDDVPPGCCFLASFPTGVTRVTMRKYWGNVSTAQLAQPGLWGAGGVAVAVTTAAALLVPYVATNGTWQYGHNSPIIGGWVVPTHAIITDIPAYQRRRRQGRGS